MEQTVRILHRYNESNYWYELNPILGKGEIGIESDTGLIKIGNGATNWNDLDYTTGDGQQYFFCPFSKFPQGENN
jgi:hypothetical protein